MDCTSQSMETCLDILSTLNESTDDYLFLCDFESDRYYYTGNIGRRYALQDRGLPYCTPEEIMQVVYPADRAALAEDLGMCSRGEKDVHNMEYRWVDREGSIVWISCRGKVQRDRDGRPYALLGRVSDTALSSQVDSLTGLFNRFRLLSDLDAVLGKEEPGWLIALGVDDFRDINIRYGRTYGDRILKQLAVYLEEAAGTTKYVYRLQGDCFALHLPHAGREDVLDVYRRLREKLPGEYTVSAGAVAYRGDMSEDAGEVYQYVEEALDRAKKNGKNDISFFSEEDFLKKLSEIELLAEIRESVRNGCEGFSLVYQPQVSAEDYSVYGAEALLRYESPVRGRVFPDQFIPLLEKTGLICEVGLWVLATALKDCRSWRQTNPSVHVSINVSYVQLKQEDIAERVLEILENSGLPGEALTLEVTESMQLQDFNYFNNIFKKWKNVGIGISVDDFGTGYSSLAYLKNLQIDEIKIDRCFVTGLQFSSYNYRLISNVLELARSSDIRVCCEGVELEEEMKILRSLRAGLLQGYLFAKPCENGQFQRLYIESRPPEYFERIQSVSLSLSGAAKVPEGERRSSRMPSSCCEVISSKVGLGMWTFLIDSETGINEMYVDESMRNIMAVDGDLTPEECYLHWYDNVNDGYYEYVNQSVARILETGDLVQLEYTWNHPAYGEVTVRCTGKRIADYEGKACVIGYHRIFSSIHETKYLSEASTTERFEYNGVRGQIYFHTGRRLLEGELIRESGFPGVWTEQKLVHPDYAESFREIFRDVHTKEDTDGVRMLLKAKDGGYSEFLLSTRHLGVEGSDRNTILVLLDAI